MSIARVRYGAAADGVERIVIFLADGKLLQVPMRHNLFAAIVPSSGFPMRVVGYDARERVVAIETGLNFMRGPTVPAAAKRYRPVFEVTGPNGTIAELELGPRVRDFQCWRGRFGTVSRQDCAGVPRTGAAIDLQLVQPAGRDVFLVGRVREPVKRVDLELPLGHRIASVRPISGHYLLAVPRRYVSRTRRHAYVVGFDAANHRAQRQGFYYKLR